MKILSHKHFDKRFAKAPRDIQVKALAAVQLFRVNPFNQVLNNHPLAGKYQGLRGIDVTGNWRIVYDPIEQDVALLTDLGTHSQLYG